MEAGPLFSEMIGMVFGVTSLAVIALRHVATAIPARLAGIHWLMKYQGKEANWFWRWKFLTADRHVRFNPDKFGWPWIPDRVSWVVPTALAILALSQVPCAWGDLEDIPLRVELGVEMLMDRACPGGGWNAGNGVVYGSALAPHPDDTAIALLVLNSRTQHPVVQASLKWLERRDLSEIFEHIEHLVSAVPAGLLKELLNTELIHSDAVVRTMAKLTLSAAAPLN